MSLDILGLFIFTIYQVYSILINEKKNENILDSFILSLQLDCSNTYLLFQPTFFNYLLFDLFCIPINFELS